MLSAICFNLDQSKILSSGNGLKRKCYLHVSGSVFTNHNIIDHNICFLSIKRQRKVCSNDRKPPGKATGD